jgi:flagellar biosynthesis/type III secretory pathway protein FliH
MATTLTMTVHMLSDAELTKLLADERSAAYGKGVVQGRKEGYKAGFDPGYQAGYTDGQGHNDTEVAD